MKKEEIKSEFDQIKERLDVYNAQLAEHMSRTAILEKSVEMQGKHFEHRNDELDARTLRIYNTLDERVKLQQAAINGLPQKALQYISIAAGAVGLAKLFL